MTAYVNVSLTPKDPEIMKEYSAKAAATIAAFGGEFLAKSPTQVLTGATDYKVQAIIAFPDKAKAEAWYQSPEYQALIELRDQGMDATFVLLG